MEKKGLLVVVLVLAVAGSIFAYPLGLTYVDNLSEPAFSKKWPEIKTSIISSSLFSGADYYDVSKLPKDISQQIWEGLQNYDLDVGDTFVFNQIYHLSGMFVFLRINNEGGWTFYAAQRR